MKMKINIKKINLAKNKISFRYKVNVKIIPHIWNSVYLNLKKGYLNFSFNPTNSIYKDKVFWMNNNFNMYFTNKEDATKFIYLMKYLEKNYIKYDKLEGVQLNSEKVFDKMFNDFWAVMTTEYS